MVEIQSAKAGNGSKAHSRELSGRLIPNDAMAARMPVASAPNMPMTNRGCPRRSPRSGRRPCAIAKSPRTSAANSSHNAARVSGGRKRRTGAAHSTRASMRSGVLVECAAPVRRLRPPLTRAALWLLFAALVLGLLAIAHGLRPDLGDRLGQPLFVIGMFGALATGIS